MPTFKMKTCEFVPTGGTGTLATQNNESGFLAVILHFARRIVPKGAAKPPTATPHSHRLVLLWISGYAMLALLAIVTDALIPLVWSTPVELGGQGLSPSIRRFAVVLRMYDSSNLLSHAVVHGASC